MTQLWGLLFDLDQTLILTESLEKIRTRGQWRQISSYFHLTRLPLETKAFLSQVRPHFRIGIVTSSPRRYAEDLIAYHHLNIPVLAAYHDTPHRHKPEPDPLLFAAKRLGIPPTQCLHIGDHVKDIVAAHRAGMIPVGLSWDGSLDKSNISDYPHTLCTSWEEVLLCLKGKVSFHAI